MIDGIGPFGWNSSMVSRVAFHIAMALAVLCGSASARIVLAEPSTADGGSDPMAGMPGMGDSGETSVEAGALRISGVQAPETPGSNGAIYLTVTNTGGEGDRLTGGASDLAATVELHESSMAGGVMEMRKVDSIDIPPGGPVMFQPGQNHIMLIGLKAPLRAGMAGSLTLTFEKQGAVVVPIVVTARGHAAEHEHH